MRHKFQTGKFTPKIATTKSNLPTRRPAGRGRGIAEYRNGRMVFRKNFPGGVWGRPEGSTGQNIDEVYVKCQIISQSESFLNTLIFSKNKFPSGYSLPGSPGIRSSFCRAAIKLHRRRNAFCIKICRGRRKDYIAPPLLRRSRYELALLRNLNVKYPASAASRASRGLRNYSSFIDDFLLYCVPGFSRNI